DPPFKRIARPVLSTDDDDVAPAAQSHVPRELVSDEWNDGAVDGDNRSPLCASRYDDAAFGHPLGDGVQCEGGCRRVPRNVRPGHGIVPCGVDGQYLARVVA